MKRHLINSLFGLQLIALGLIAWTRTGANIVYNSFFGIEPADDWRKDPEMQEPDAEITFQGQDMIMRGYAYGSFLVLEMEDQEEGSETQGEGWPVTLLPVEVDRLREFLDAHYPRPSQPNRLSIKRTSGRIEHPAYARRADDHI